LPSAAAICAFARSKSFGVSQTLKRKSMKTTITVVSAMLAGAALGIAAINALHAQGKAPGAYAIVDISEITDANVFRQQLLAKVTPAALVPFGGQYIVRTENVTALDGTPPQRFVIIGFDSMDKAKAWSAAAAQKEVDAIRAKSTKSRQFLVEGLSN
jgi:uncharacterized protein (DUF1330 family)